MPPLGVGPFAGGVEHGDVAAEAGGAVGAAGCLAGGVDGGQLPQRVRSGRSVDGFPVGVDGVFGQLPAVGEVAADGDLEPGLDAVRVTNGGQAGGVGAADVVGSEPPAEVRASGGGLGDPVRGGMVRGFLEGSHRRIWMVAVDDDRAEQCVGGVLDVTHRQGVVAVHPVLAALEVVRRVGAVWEQYLVGPLRVVE